VLAIIGKTLLEKFVLFAKLIALLALGLNKITVKPVILKKSYSQPLTVLSLVQVINISKNNISLFKIKNYYILIDFK